MNCKISVNLDTLNVNKSDELCEIFDVKIEDNTLHLEIYRVDNTPTVPYNISP